MNKSSKISGFYKLSIDQRLEKVKEAVSLSEEEVDTIKNTGALDPDQADRMIENVIGVMPVTLGVATNFKINGRDYLVPMAIEEPSVVAAASNSAKMVRAAGGFTTSSTEPRMIGQIQLTGLGDPEAAREAILSKTDELMEMANEQDPILVKFGGGAKEIEVRIIETIQGKMVIVHIIVDCRDAMGANAVNTMAEAIAPELEEITGGKVYLRIISNLAVHRLARAEAVFSKDVIGGPEVVEGILNAFAFADADPYRATTHNKGIMNGISAVVLATGNDTRAIEAGAHSYASISGEYKTLTKYEKNADGDIVGRIELPMAVGLIGGATAVHPTARACVKILGVKTASELGEVMAVVGLAQNFAALRALATEGIQRGHMGLHARNLAVMAGAEGAEIEKVVERMVSEKKVRMDRAKEVLDEIRGG